jgi:hypothetical protein
MTERIDDELRKWVQVSTELLAELGEWSEPVRVKVETDVDNVLELIFQRYEP